MTVATLRSKCLQALQKLARISEADDNGICTCVSCGKQKHYKDMDGGHFIPKGASSYWALREENVHPQCKGCNGFGMRNGSAAQQYTLWMQDMYGADFVEEMLQKKNTICKIKKFEYEDMLKYFNEQIKYHQERIGE